MGFWDQFPDEYRDHCDAEWEAAKADWDDYIEDQREKEAKRDE